MAVRVNGVDRTLTADEATQVMAARADAAGTKSAGPSTTLGVPSDAFSVSATIYGSFIPAGGRIIAGSWNFRDNYVNGSDPDDVAAIEVNLEGCYQIAGTTTHVYDYSGGNHDNLAWLANGGVSNGSPAIGLNDSVSGFKLLTDHGTFTAQYNPINAGCKYHEIGGQFVFEHNQDGGGGVSVSVGWGFVTIGYANAGSVLRKSTSAMYY